MPIFDVILPTYNNLDELKQCIADLESQTFQDFQVFICVDGSTDGTMEYLKETSFSFHYQIITHPNFENKGRNPTRNLVLPHLQSRFLCMIDSDIRPDKDLMQKHFDLLIQKKCISIGEVIYTNIKKNIWADYLQTRGKNKYKNLEVIPSYYLNSQNLAMKSDDFISIRGQDVNMTTYGGGDTEFGYRISQLLNIPVVFNKDAFGFSEMPKTLDFALIQMIEFGSINLPYIHGKYPEFKSLFRFDLIESSSPKSLFIKLILNKWIYQTIYYILPFASTIIKRKLIHYLVFYSISKGYNSYLDKQISEYVQ